MKFSFQFSVDSVEPIRLDTVYYFILIFLYTVSYNQPKICPNATWNPNGITLVNKSIIGEKARGFFINFNNTIIVAGHNLSQILTWTEDRIESVQNLIVNLFEYTNPFETVYGDIYFEKANEQGKIYKWLKNSITSVLVKDFTVLCYGLFVDIDNTIYCCVRFGHKVVSSSLRDTNNTLIIVAGTGSAGSSSNELDFPYGIFVNTNFDLYVADTGIKRIQRFQSGEKNGTTVAGQGIPQNLQLNHPTNVVLDSDGYLFIADNGNHRIIRSGFDQFECIIGCTGQSGAASNELNQPYAIRFDSYGNLYVSDEQNDRIQKFTIVTDFCGKCDQKSR